MSTTPVCPADRGEKCQCDTMDDDPTFFARHGRYSWDTEEVVGYTDVQLQDGKRSRVWGRGSVEILDKLQMVHNLEAKIREWCTTNQNLPLEQYQRLIDAYNTFVVPQKKYPTNPDVPVTPAFIQEGIRIVARTTHKIQDLDPAEDKFLAVNKPKSVAYVPDAVPQGRDGRLRSYQRTIVIKLTGNHDSIARLMIHELAHTPANHLCFRHDDHDTDFRVFQCLFTEIAVRNHILTNPNTFLRMI